MSMINNLINDIKATKKYGLLTHLKYLFDYDHVIVNIHHYVDYSPEYIENPLFDIYEVDINDENILHKWVEIVNDAFEFETPYTIKSARYYLNNHIYKRVLKLYFICDKKSDKPIGTYFIGSFKNNNNIGTSGRLAVKKEYQGHGVGKLLVLHGLKMYKALGFKLIEEVAVAKRDYSIRLYLRCGAIPEFRKKYLQLKPTRKFWFITWLARRKVKKMYRAHLNKLDEGFLRE